MPPLPSQQYMLTRSRTTTFRPPWILDPTSVSRPLARWAQCREKSTHQVGRVLGHCSRDIDVFYWHSTQSPLHRSGYEKKLATSFSCASADFDWTFWLEPLHIRVCIRARRNRQRPHCFDDNVLLLASNNHRCRLSQERLMQTRCPRSCRTISGCSLNSIPCRRQR